MALIFLTEKLNGVKLRKGDEEVDTNCQKNLEWHEVLFRIGSRENQCQKQTS